MRKRRPHTPPPADLCTPSEETQELARYIAMVVRNELEDFHSQYLEDTQMMALNPIIRNAICTALHALALQNESRAAREFVDFTLRMIPDYWEPPQLAESFIELLEHLEGPVQEIAAREDVCSG